MSLSGPTPKDCTIKRKPEKSRLVFAEMHVDKPLKFEGECPLHRSGKTGGFGKSHQLYYHNRKTKL